MEKALVFLKDLLVKTRLDEEIVSEHIVFDINEAIEELEEAMKPNSCEGCKHGKYGADSRGIEVECTLIWHCARGNGFPDRYEPKEK